MSRPDLSPAAQTVLEATAWAVYRAPAASCPDLRRLVAPKIAAALRALADHKQPAWDGTGPACHWTPTPHTRQELRNIAAELDPTYEGQS